MLQNHKKSGLGRLDHCLAMVFNTIAGIALSALMVITCIDVFGRYLLNKPLTGSTELIELILAGLVFIALPVISWRNDHVVVDIFDNYLPPLVHFIRGIIIHCIFAVTLYFVGERLLQLATRSLEFGEVSEFFHIPLGWTIRLAGIMCWSAMAALVVLGIPSIWRAYKLKTLP